jgi:fluoride exporter
MNGYLLVFFGAGLGGAVRFAMAEALSVLSPHWPLATFFVNCFGGFVMGFLLGAGPFIGLGELMRLSLVTGFLGGFTTFSAFSADMFGFVEAGHWGKALGYATASVMGSFLLLVIGNILAKRIFS